MRIAINTCKDMRRSVWFRHIDRANTLDASAGRRERIRQRINQEEEPVVRKKITVGMVLAIASVLSANGVPSLVVA